MRQIHSYLVAAIALVSGGLITTARARADEPPAVFVIEGSIVDSNSKPMPEVDVLLLHNDMEKRTTRVAQRTRVDQSGKFIFEAVPRIPEAVNRMGTYHILALKDKVPIAGQILGRTTIFPLTLRADVREAVKVKGVVFGPERRPQSGVSVWVEMIMGDRKELTRQSFPRLVFSTLSGFEMLQARTNERGEFEIENLPKGADVRLEVLHPAFARKSVNGTTPAVLDIALEPGTVLQGQVLYSDSNRPAAGAFVEAERQRDTPNEPTERGRTIADEQGKYRIESLRPGKYNVWADQEGWTIQAQEGYELKAGESSAALFLNLIRGGFVKGRIVDDQGAPVNPEPGSNIQWRGPSRPVSGLTNHFGKINPDGTFQIRVAPGENRISFNLTGNWKSATGGGLIVNVAEGETVEIRYVVKPK